MVKKSANFDYALLGITLALLAVGLVSLYSASAVESFKHSGNSTYYIQKQLLSGVVFGLIGMYVASRIDYHFWQKNLPLLVVISLGLLAATKLTPLGVSAGGASRWLNLGFTTFQPAELAKIVLVFYIAAWIGKKGKAINDFTLGLLPSLIIVALFAGMILWQPDFGTMSVLVGVSFFMLIVGGVNWKYLFWAAVSGFLLTYAIVHFEPYRLKRITAFLNPASDPQGISYHVNQALLAVGSGGLWGYGYGLSRQKHSYLPEVMGDSIFAVTAEELGFIRITAILALFVAFLIRGIALAKKAPDEFGRLTAFGITAWIALQAIINIGAMVKLLPLTGIPLPFFSYGSSAMLINLSAVGVLLNISRQAKT